MGLAFPGLTLELVSQCHHSLWQPVMDGACLGFLFKELCLWEIDLLWITGGSGGMTKGHCHREEWQGQVSSQQGLCTCLICEGGIVGYIWSLYPDEELSWVPICVGCLVSSVRNTHYPGDKVAMV